MSAGGDPEAATPEDDGRKAALSARIARESGRVTRAMAVVDCCLFARESLRVSEDCRPDTMSALEAAYELMYDATGNLELIVEELARQSRTAEHKKMSQES